MADTTLQTQKQVTWEDFLFSVFAKTRDKYPSMTVIGKRIYIRTSQYIVTAEFSGQAQTAATTLALTSLSGKGGLIDANDVPLNIIFKESKQENVYKSVLFKNIPPLEKGILSIQWSGSDTMPEEDLNALNEILLKYLEIFK